jgi:hypothetical protein
MPDTMQVFIEDEVASLNSYQESRVFHPFTCDKCGAGFRATTTGWVCPDCDYQQNWARIRG